MADSRPITYPPLRQLVPYYHAPKGYDLGAAQERNLQLLAFFLEPILDRWGIATRLRKAHFLGQSATETTDFTTFYESTLDGKPIDGRNYEGRADLGNVRRGDGARFIGRGMIQVTGRDNYGRAEADVDTFENSHARMAPPSLLGNSCRGYVAGFVARPQRMAEFPGVVESACAYWVRRGLNAMADADNAAAITRVINPAMLGYSKRLHYTEKSKALLLIPSSQEVAAAALAFTRSGMGSR